MPHRVIQKVHDVVSTTPGVATDTRLFIKRFAPKATASAGRRVRRFRWSSSRNRRQDGASYVSSAGRPESVKDLNKRRDRILLSMLQREQVLVVDLHTVNQLYQAEVRRRSVPVSLTVAGQTADAGGLAEVKKADVKTLRRCVERLVDYVCCQDGAGRVLTALQGEARLASKAVVNPRAHTLKVGSEKYDLAYLPDAELDRCG